MKNFRCSCILPLARNIKLHGQQWNKFEVLKEAKKFPKKGFSNVQFDEWVAQGNIFGIR
jgi:hypothetical protein